MATMTSIRERQKVVMWAFLVIFLLSLSIGGLVGGANVIDRIFGSNLTGNAVGAVNSDRITIDELGQAISLQTEQAREQYGELNDRLLEQAETQAWGNLVNLILLTEEIEGRRLRATGDEIFYILENYPPTFLMQQEAFQREGQFDVALYQQALLNPTGNEWAPVEVYLGNVVPGEKMNFLVQAMAYTSEEEVKSTWYDRNTEVTIDFIYIADSKIKTDEIDVSEDDLKTLHRRDRERYTLPETRLLEYVVWEKSPTAEDSAEVENLARLLIARARAGEDFADLALEYSEDPGSGPGGGDLGWFGKGQMVAPFEQAAFDAKLGEIVGPVETRSGYHIIQVEDHREEEGKLQVKARHILLGVEISPQTVNRLRSEANIFSFDAVDSTFALAIESHQLTSLTSPPLQVTDKYLPPPVGMLRSAVSFAFNAEEVDQVSDVFENERCYLVARLAKTRPAGLQPLEAVRDNLERIARQETAREQVALIMANIQQQLSSESDLPGGTSQTVWQAVADSFPEATYSSGVTAKLNASFTGIGRSPVLKGVLKTLSPGQVSGVIRLERGEIIVRLVNRQEPVWEQYAIERESEHQRLLDRRRNAIWGQWLEDLKKQAQIIDNRHLFF